MAPHFLTSPVRRAFLMLANTKTAIIFNLLASWPKQHGEINPKSVM